MESISEGKCFRIGGLEIEARLTWGHSPGGMTYVITGRRPPIAIVGDSLFAGSMGGGTGGGVTTATAGRGSASRTGSDTIIAGSSTSTSFPAGSAAGGAAGAAAVPAPTGTSSSLKIRRIEARMSSIDGSPAGVVPGWVPAGAPGDAAGFCPGGVWDALILSAFSAARLAGRVGRVCRDDGGRALELAVERGPDDLQFRARTIEPYRRRRNRCLTVRLRGKHDLG